ncbi:hypothetical protein E2C01_088222 [Portunus trituberculatus]|uniref:Uncharacterized protein n=1 Tax=Portunus trituberculatus TaxID=210409 RepID=A0A5B7J5J9_PORTR|nr:hypothetical protein [Portunus trituberculatus]
MVQQCPGSSRRQYCQTLGSDSDDFPTAPLSISNLIRPAGLSDALSRWTSPIITRALASTANPFRKGEAHAVSTSHVKKEGSPWLRTPDCADKYQALGR